MLKKLSISDLIIFKSLSTSIVSKIVTIAIQLFSLPIAIGALGVESFSTYVVITSCLAWFSLSSFGIFPGLTREIANNRNDDSVLSLVNCAIKIVTYGLLTFLLLSTLVFLISSIFDIDFFSLKRYFSDDMLIVWFWAAIFTLLNIYGSIGEAVRLGLNEQYKTNIINTISNIISLIFIFVVANYFPTLISFVFAVGFFPAMGKIFNLISIYLTTKNRMSNIYTISKTSNFRKLISVGWLFFIGEILTVMSTQGLIVLVGSREDAGTAITVATLAFIFRFMALSGGMVVMVTQPLSAVLMGLYSNCKYNDYYVMARKYIYILTVFSTVASIVICLYGSDIFTIWSRGEISISDSDSIILGVYFFSVTFSHLLFIFVFSSGMTNRPMIFKILESLFIIIVILVFVDNVDVSVITLLLALSSLLLVTLPYVVLSLLLIKKEVK